MSTFLTGWDPGGNLRLSSKNGARAERKVDIGYLIDCAKMYALVALDICEAD
jgi:hypothetical protein